MNLFVLGMLASGEAGAQERYVLEAVAVGDFDCAGTLGQAELYYDQETGDVSAVLTLGMREEDLPEPFSGANGWSVGFADFDEDGCEDLEITVLTGEVFLVSAVDHPDTVIRAQEGVGDTVPDMHILLGKPLDVPTATLDVGGIGEYCDWFDYCWFDDCYQTCGGYGMLSSYKCGENKDGTAKWCYKWGCTHWKQHCI